jgi:mannosylglucosylglycerate synthase
MDKTMTHSSHHIGFISTRFAGTDGVSLETEKWATVFERMGHKCFYFAGECDRDPEMSLVVPEAFYRHPDIDVLNQQAYSGSWTVTKEARAAHPEIAALQKDFFSIYVRPPQMTRRIHEIKEYLKVRHVVINSVQAQQIASRYGVTARVVPNVMDFDTPPPEPDAYTQTVRADFGIGPGEYFLLQPTRVIQRKGIEHSVELVKRLGLPAKLVISHASGDEGTDYEQRVREYAHLLDVTVRFESDQVQDERGLTTDGRKIYTLGDVYPHSDLVTYPSSIEGFGNAFLEAVYYRRPILVNNYSIYEVDIKPKGFRVAWFDGFINQDTLKMVSEILQNPTHGQLWAEENYQLAKRHFSFTVLEHRLQSLLEDCLGHRV